MWIACGRIPTSYMKNSSDNRHKYYNFHTEVHFNVYLYNIPTEFPMTAANFTQQDHYLVVIHTTEDLLRNLKTNLEMTTQRPDMARWYARKDNDQ
eukprot:5529086-Amphidinium_carterae.1